MPKEEQHASHFPSPETLQKFAEKDALLLWYHAPYDLSYQVAGVGTLERRYKVITRPWVPSQGWKSVT